jgi:Zn-dependent protease
MNGNLRIGNLFGIPFYISPSWFLILILVTFTYGSGFAAQFPNLAAGVPSALGLVTALLLFASVLAHELGHSLVALRQGINVQSITLFLFGGLASLEQESKTPADAFWVAIAGPLVSILLSGTFTLIQMATGATGVGSSVAPGWWEYSQSRGVETDGQSLQRSGICQSRWTSVWLGGDRFWFVADRPIRNLW